MAHHEAENPMGAGAVTTKDMLLGACSLVLVLGGGLWSLWDRDTTRTIEANHRTNNEQWIRLRELNDKLIEDSAKLERLEQDLVHYENRLRALEFTLAGRARH